MMEHVSVDEYAQMMVQHSPTEDDVADDAAADEDAVDGGLATKMMQQQMTVLQMIDAPHSMPSVIPIPNTRLTPPRNRARRKTPRSAPSFISSPYQTMVSPRGTLTLIDIVNWKGRDP